MDVIFSDCGLNGAPGSLGLMGNFVRAGIVMIDLLVWVVVVLEISRTPTQGLIR